MRDTTMWPAAECLTTVRLRLEPLSVDHAEEAVRAFADQELYRFIGGGPLDLPQLRARYQRQSAGHSPDGTQGWLNWMIRLASGPDPGDPAIGPVIDPVIDPVIGTVQATLTRLQRDDDEFVAELAWVIGLSHQGQGYAGEAATAVAQGLRQQGTVRLQAHIHPGHPASQAVARRLGLHPTDLMAGGEIRWTS